MITVIRWHGEPGLDDLLAAYHLATEAEKGTPVASFADLPARYRAEADDPATAFADDVVLLATASAAAPDADAVAADTVADAAVGCVVLTRTGDEGELKRLWVAPAHRGRGVATALARRALAEAGDLPVRLSVWHWRADALGLYARLGFAQAEPWDARPGLVCLRRPA